MRFVQDQNLPLLRQPIQGGLQWAPFVLEALAHRPRWWCRPSLKYRRLQVQSGETQDHRSYWFRLQPHASADNLTVPLPRSIAAIPILSHSPALKHYRPTANRWAVAWSIIRALTFGSQYKARQDLGGYPPKTGLFLGQIPPQSTVKRPITQHEARAQPSVYDPRLSNKVTARRFTE